MRYWIDLPGADSLIWVFRWLIAGFDPRAVQVTQSDECDVVITWWPGTVEAFAGKKLVVFY